MDVVSGWVDSFCFFFDDVDSCNGSVVGEVEDVDEFGDWDFDEVGEIGVGYRWFNRDGS